MTAIATGPIPFDSLDSPAVVMERLIGIERDLAVRQLNYEHAASEWFRARRDQGLAHARALIASTASSVTEKKAEADIAAYATPGAEYEAEYNAIRAVIGVLETRASVCQSILRAQGRS